MKRRKRRRRRKKGRRRSAAAGARAAGGSEALFALEIRRVPSSIITVLKPATSASESTRCVRIGSGAFLRTVTAGVA